MNTSKQINIMILLVFLSVFVTGGYTLWDSSRADEAEGEQLERTVWRGAWLFSQNCRTCHGDAGEGGQASNRLRVAPALNRPDLQGMIEDSEGNLVRDPNEYATDFKFVYYTITCGRVGKVMPAWGVSQGGPLNEEQIKQLTTLILEGARSFEELKGEDEGEEGGETGAAAEAEPADGWEQALDFARHGEPAYHEEGDDRNELALAQPLEEGDTEIVFNHVTIEGAPVFGAQDRLAILDEDGEVAEIVTVTEVDEETNTATVERGVGSTEPGTFEAGTEVLNQPAVTQGEIVERSCGQTAGAATNDEFGDPTTQLTIVASGIAWNTSALSAVANAPLTITVDNQDDGTPHNWRLFGNPDGDGDPIAGTEIENGPVTQTLNFGPLDPGDYYYDCEVHPQMFGTLRASVPGAETPAAGATPETATTPEAAATP
jgi:mono/diheme cytochrome c family protein